MDKLFTVGETSKMLNIPVSTLHYYDKVGLVPPTFRSQETGYRYYTLDQIGLLDHIKYLQKFGFSLAEISSIIKDGNVDMLIPKLREKISEYKSQIDDINKQIKTAEWYIDFFSYAHNSPPSGEITVKELNERYAIATDVSHIRWDIKKNEPDIELTKIKNLPNLRDLHYKRQWGGIINYSDMLDGSFSIIRSFMYLLEKPSDEIKYSFTIPKGDYLCFTCRLFKNGFNNTERIKEYFAETGFRPGLVIADEYEDNIVNFSEAVFEIQIQIIK